jgi:hypothetical protein
MRRRTAPFRRRLISVGRTTSSRIHGRRVLRVAMGFIGIPFLVVGPLGLVHCEINFPAASRRVIGVRPGPAATSSQIIQVLSRSSDLRILPFAFRGNGVTRRLTVSGTL